MIVVELMKSMFVMFMSSMIPPVHIYATCILTPEIQSNIDMNFSRSSNDQSSGDNEPKSNIAQLPANNVLNVLVISASKILS